MVERPGTAAEQTLEPSKPWTPRASVEGMRIFTAHTLELQKRINKRPPEHFSDNAVSVEILEQLGNFFKRLADLKKSEPVKAASTAALPDNGQPVDAADQEA